MERLIGTVSRGIRAPIIREGDDLAAIVTDSVIEALASEKIPMHDKDIVAVTEAVLGRAQGNYATVDNIAADVRAKFGGGTVGVIFPILSRNRFSIMLRGIAKGAKKIVLMLSYPSDEVGNHLVDMDLLDEKGIDPWRDVLSEAEFRAHFGYKPHAFTGVDYIAYYGDLIREAGAEAEIIFANRAVDILPYATKVLCCDIHTRARTKRLLKAAGAELVLGMDELLTASVDGSGFNPDYGLLGANKATEDKVKLFPRDCDAFVHDVQQKVLTRTGKKVEVMVYGDGAFKDPAGKIWELADPVVSPGYTEGLEGQPNEVKLKYLADNQFAHLKGLELKEAISDFIRKKDADLMGNMVSQGTTPRKLTDLIGSLCDLTSGSGDKGTPIIYIQGYFDNYTDATK
ncbi:MAG: coenzyme F420-0:L-glutamate ligase [Angelakisella sp.]